MPVDVINLHELLTATRDADHVVAYHDGRTIYFNEFRAAVNEWTGVFKAQSQLRYGLFTDYAYPFAVLLFALLHAGKEVWISGNNRPGTAQQLRENFGCQLIGDWDAEVPFKIRQAPFVVYPNGHKSLSNHEQDQLTAVRPEPFDYAQDRLVEGRENDLSALTPNTSRLVLFTSGSTGEAKPVVKLLSQLESEIAVLEQQWGNQLGNAEVLSTVSHQHIYGLLFRILWPLATGRCFHSAIYLNAELLINGIRDKSACWVASPAHLKRLDAESPWQALAVLTAIFSSGGALPTAARQLIWHESGQQVIEIYGSTETGGIAWKDQDNSWTLFPGLSLKINNGECQLTSPYLQENKPYRLEDNIMLLADGGFKLNGRADRIVKIEEKRLSLTEMEQRLADNPLVQNAHCLVMKQNRDKVCAAIEFTEAGWQALINQGRKQVINQLRTTLQPWFEAVLMPKKWLLMNEMPLTTQGKTDNQLITSLLAFDKTKLPSVYSYEVIADGIKLGIKVPHNHELIYFPDHFAGYPILPGVVQLAWVEHFGKLLFGVGNADKTFSHLEVIKFLKVIRPGTELILTLKWITNSGELHFNYSDTTDSYSSGRMIYKPL